MHFLCNSLIINRYYFCCFLRFFCCFGKNGKKSPFHEERGHSIYYIIRYACTRTRVRVLLCYRSIFGIVRGSKLLVDRCFYAIKSGDEEEDNEHVDDRTDGL